MHLSVKLVKLPMITVYKLMAVIEDTTFIMILIVVLPNVLMVIMLILLLVSVKTVLLGAKLVMGLPMINVIPVGPIPPTLPKLTIRRLCSIRVLLTVLLANMRKHSVGITVRSAILRAHCAISTN